MIEGNQKIGTGDKPPLPAFVKLIPAIVLVVLWCQAFARGDSATSKRTIKPADYYLDDDQERLDMLDGLKDGKIDLGDSANTALATKVYYGIVDSIRSLLDKPAIDETRKRTYREYLHSQLHKINGSTVYDVKHYENTFRFIYGQLNAIADKSLYDYLAHNINQAFNNFQLLRDEPRTDSFLILAANYRPDLVFLNYDLYDIKDYSQHVLEETAKIAPVTVKRYFNPGDPIYEALKRSNDSVVKVILRIKDRLTRKSNAYTLLDGIVHGDYTMQQADSIGSNPRKFLQAMIKLRSKKKPLGSYSLDDDLAIYALKFVRVLDDMHNEPDDKRFASIEKFSPEEIYTLMVYSEEEIFTSTFNGLFNRLMIKMGPVSGLEFLDGLGDNRFRTFVKMCAGFGKLDEFLQTMTPLHQQMLMVRFVTGLEKYSDLSQAVEVADAFSSIGANDTLALKILKASIKYEYTRQRDNGNSRGTAIYGLLSGLFVERNSSSSNWFTTVASEYAVSGFDRVPIGKLFDRDGVDRWLIYFYDDEDGESSYTSFIRTFTDLNWNIVDSGTYVIIQSKTGKPVQIYANKSKSEYEGQEQLQKLFADNNYEPNVMVHRGHSYYAYKTIEKVKENTQVFVLGSCGGYHSISTIIDRAPEVSIISSKQIGTKSVNNPMLKLIAECIRQGKDIEWQTLWAQLDLTVKGNPGAYERFLDYIPPHKNLGAIFIKTYNKMMGQD